MDIIRFKKLPIMGILRGLKQSYVEALTQCVISSGMETIEITMNTPDAAELIKNAVKTSKGRLMIGAGTVLSVGAQVGEDSLLYPNVSVLRDCIVGERAILHSGVVIGSDGFGFAREPGALHKIPQIGIVRIGNDVEIGANSCVDRATAGETVIMDFVKIDNLVQVAHNCEVGDRTAISAQSGIGGSTKVGRDVIMAGQVGLADHMSVGDGVIFAAKSGSHGFVAPGRIMAGAPARDHREWVRMNGHLGRLDRYAREIADLKQRVEELENESG